MTGTGGGGEMLDAEFDLPYEAKAKEIAIDAAKVKVALGAHRTIAFSFEDVERVYVEDEVHDAFVDLVGWMVDDLMKAIEAARWLDGKLMFITDTRNSVTFDSRSVIDLGTLMLVRTH